MSHPPDPTRQVPEAPLDADALRLLLDVTRRINAERDPQALLETIVDSLVTLTRADRGFLMLKEGEGLRFAVARDRRGHPLEAEKFRVSESVVSEVAQTGETRLIDDAASSAAYHARLSIVNLSLRTILCVALRTDRGILGVIYVDSNAITRRFTERDVPLVEGFAAQAAVALERVRLQAAELDRDRLRRQIETAAEIQRTFLPGTFPETPGLRGAVATLPALQVGGDFYDVIRFPDGRIGLVVGDVSGKGVPAALFGARLLSDVRYEALYHGDAGATLAAVNEIVARRSTRGMFVTLLYAVYDPALRSVTFGNAGHVAPLVRTADGRLVRWDETPSLPLGVRAGQVFPTATKPLGHGETLLLLTDGVIDAVDASGERFGEDRIDAGIFAGSAAPTELVSRLVEAVARFTGEVPQADDVTVLAVSPAS
ncbi:MAG TPA: GAF domain-containing SpoIIE family protein phosphatase [Planctomycetota bacterium]|nr:GAF domain-containing SpoIIE family protein phosphatase [Planctomycetota bacterium]